MLVSLAISLALTALGAFAQTQTATDNTTSVLTVIQPPVTEVAQPTRVLHQNIGGGHQFVGEDGYYSEFHGPHLSARRWNVNKNNWQGSHTTLNDYQATPTPGIHICDQADFHGNCVYQQVVADPKVCHRTPTGKAQKGGSFLIEKDIQCAFHADLNCQGTHTSGRYMWPDLSELRSGWDGLSGDILAYKCRKCEGCWEDNAPDWDGDSVQELQPASGKGWLISKDLNGHYTLVGHVGKGGNGR